MTSPCFPTPKEAETLFEEGFEEQMAATKFIDISTGKAYNVIAPLAVETVYDIDGVKIMLKSCVFFKNKKCLLHDLCLKPLEGRLADHNNTEEESLELRLKVLKEWDFINDIKKLA